MPIDEIAQVPGPDLANVGAAGGFVSASGGQREIFYPGDRVFKVGFRKIKWGFFDEKTAEKARLLGRGRRLGNQSPLCHGEKVKRMSGLSVSWATNLRSWYIFLRMLLFPNSIRRVWSRIQCSETR